MFLLEPTYLDRALVSYNNLCTGLLLHSLLSVASVANNETGEIIPQKILHRNEQFLVKLRWAVICRRLKCWVSLDKLGNELIPVSGKLFTFSIFPCIDYDPHVIIDGLWRRRPCTLRPVV